ncbi:hypothetical protein FQA47_002376 [Oryzias melastigma]|uniref:Uncharacterized protein n=1 Tax=Oryzias melastigma TaxID=30732 RepID=A0A834FKB3_ORYME|nr:hypothetical protein FQA47_002376 [Oryzias melastigma]
MTTSLMPCKKQKLLKETSLGRSSVTDTRLRNRPAPKTDGIDRAAHSQYERVGDRRSTLLPFAPPLRLTRFTDRGPNQAQIHGFKLRIGAQRLQVSNGQTLGDDRPNKHGIILVMWIATPQESQDLLRNDVRRCASWILVFLDILKIIGNS